MSFDEEIPHTEERNVPKFLYVVYAVVLVIGILGFFFFWNGSKGWLDRGFWQGLQKAADTTAPYQQQE